MQDERCDADVILDVVFDRGPAAAKRVAGEADYSRLEGLGNEVAIETLELAPEVLETE